MDYKEKVIALLNSQELSKEQKEKLESIFPELSESEDERIRKGLIQYFSTFTLDTFAGLDPKKILSWLKKQGEKKLDTDFSDLRTWKYIVDAVLTEKEGIGQYLDNPFTEEVAKKLQKRFGKIKQKPAFEMKTPEESLGIDSDTYNKIVDECIYGNHKSADKVEPKFKVKYAGSEYNVLKVKDIAGVTYYGIEDEPNHIDYVQAENCERVGGYGIKEKGSPYPTKPAVFSEHNPVWSEEQMQALNAINVTGGISYAGQGQVLIELYNDLKKL